LIGYTMYAALLLTLGLGLYTMIRLFRGKGAGIWGKVTGAVLIVLAITFVLWAKVEVPSYERQQAKINLQLGLQYLQVGDDANALQSFLKISKFDQETYTAVQPKISELQLKIASANLEEAKSLHAQGQHQAALQALQKSLEYMVLDESKVLMPTYKAAAGQK